MEVKDLNLPNAQTMAIENEKVFSKILVSKDRNSGYPKDMEDGVVFVSSDVKLVAKDGSNNVLSAIGLWQEGREISDSTVRFFRPTSFGDFVTAFKYTNCGSLERYFRKGSENNTYVNQLICSFLKNNLEEEKIDAKELAQTSFEIKDIVEDKAQTYYAEKENVYLKKIQKYQEKIKELDLERQGVNSFGEVIESEEYTIGEVMESFVAEQGTEETNLGVEMPVEEVLKYFNANKDAVCEE